MTVKVQQEDFDLSAEIAAMTKDNRAIGGVATSSAGGATPLISAIRPI